MSLHSKKTITFPVITIEFHSAFAVNVPSLLSDSLLSKMADKNVVGEVEENYVRSIQSIIRSRKLLLYDFRNSRKRCVES